MLVKISSSGRKCTSVPRFSVSPVIFIGLTSKPSRTSITRSCVKPRLNSMACTLPSRRTVRRSHLLSAFTQLTPTPCRPPDTL